MAAGDHADGCNCSVRPNDEPQPVVGYVERRDHNRPTTKAQAEAESDRQAGGILARARAKL